MSLVTTYGLSGMVAITWSEQWGWLPERAADVSGLEAFIASAFEIPFNLGTWLQEAINLRVWVVLAVLSIGTNAAIAWRMHAMGLRSDSARDFAVRPPIVGFLAGLAYAAATWCATSFLNRFPTIWGAIAVMVGTLFVALFVLIVKNALDLADSIPDRSGTTSQSVVREPRAEPRLTNGHRSLAGSTKDRNGKGSRSPAKAVVGALATLVIVAGAFALMRRGGNGDDRYSSPAQVTATVDVGRGPNSVAATRTSVWVVNSDDGTVTRLDPATNQAVQTIEVGRAPRGVAATEDAVWVALQFSSRVVRIDPETNQVVATIDAGTGGAPLAGTESIAATELDTWAVQVLGGQVSRIDSRSNRVVGAVSVGLGFPAGIAASAGAIWVTNSEDESVTRIDPTTNQVVARISVGRDPNAVAIADDAVWVTNGTGTLTRIDPETNTVVSTTEMHSIPTAVTATKGNVWVVEHLGRSVARVNATSGEVIERIPVGVEPTGIDSAGGVVWVTNFADGTVSRVEVGRD